MGPIRSFAAKTESERVYSSTMNFQMEDFFLSLGSAS